MIEYTATKAVVLVEDALQLSVKISAIMQQADTKSKLLLHARTDGQGVIRSTRKLMLSDAEQRAQAGVSTYFTAASNRSLALDGGRCTSLRVLREMAWEIKRSSRVLWCC